MAEIFIPANTSVDINAALSITPGSSAISVQCKSDTPVYLTSEAAAPTKVNDGLRLTANKQANLNAGDAGAWASAYLADALFFAEVV